MLKNLRAGDKIVGLIPKELFLLDCKRSRELEKLFHSNVK